MSWYIDSIDARAGLAFASRRPPDLMDRGTLDADLPAAFISPPDFRAVLMPHRAIGLSAANRTYQAGLFLRGKEVAFPSLDDVIEFTRRCFLRGGGGDGGDRTEGGPPTPLPEPGQSPEGTVGLDENFVTEPSLEFESNRVDVPRGPQGVRDGCRVDTVRSGHAFRLGLRSPRALRHGPSSGCPHEAQRRRTLSASCRHNAGR